MNRRFARQLLIRQSLINVLLCTAVCAADFDVGDFGAKADGQTDCAPAIQQAIEAAGKAGSGRVIIPAADTPYLVKSTVKLNHSNIELVGKGATLKLADNAVKSSRTHVLLVSGKPGQEISSVKVRGLTIDANFWNQKGAVLKVWRPRGLLAEHVQNLLVEDVHVRRAWVALAFSVGADRCEARECTVSQWHNDGFDAGNSARNIRFVRCKAYDAMSQSQGGLSGGRDSAWEIEDGAQQITLTDCVVEKTDAIAYKIRSHNVAAVLKDIRLVRCRALAPTRRGFQIEGRDHDTRTEDVILEDCQTTAELDCRNGADRVQIVGGTFGMVKLAWPRRVHIAGATIEQMLIYAEEKSDGKETYRPQITLESIHLKSGQPKIVGDPKLVRIVPRLPAFPGAEGFGAMSLGGRRGRVIEVTNLNDDGPGSFRAAVTAEGRRIVVFRVAGTIRLKSWVRIQNPYITIAGQTAPGGGIALRNDPSNRYPTLTIETHDVVVRHLRVRPGASQGKSSSLDAISILGGHDIILDHCSASWSTDGVIDVVGNTRDVTLQWCIFSEGLHASTHEKGPHSTALAVGGFCQRVSIHHCLLAHSYSRNPRLANARPIDFVNNVIYNWGSYVLGVSYSGDTQVNFVGNYIKPGPSSNERIETVFIRTSKGTQPSVFVAGNLASRRPGERPKELPLVREADRKFQATTRFTAPAVTSTSAAAAYEQVLREVGATLPLRDAVDRRIVTDVRKSTGKIIDDASQVGGWPKLAAGTAPADTDHDGMPDEWEKKSGLNPNNPHDNRHDADGDGYTNIEEFLNGTDPRARANPK